MTDIGFADAVTGKLAALDPEKFQSAAQRMTVKAQRPRSAGRSSWPTRKNVRMGKSTRQSPRKGKLRRIKTRRRNKRPGPARKEKPARPGSKERGAAARTQKKNQARTRFQGSKPVKKGQTSGRKKSVNYCAHNMQVYRLPIKW